MSNQSEIETWNGPVGQRWAVFQEVLDARLVAFGAKVLEAAALAEGMRVLDVGCGCGELSLHAARAVGASGSVVGLDVSRPMLARARERASTTANVQFVEHDAATYVTEAPFDVVLSRFGVMFFDDPDGAFANLRRMTKHRGLLTFVCWQSLDKNAWAAVPLSGVLRVAPPAPPAPPHAPGPFAFADRERVLGILGRAGFHDVSLTSAELPFKLGDDLEDAVLFASRMGPAARALRDLDEATATRALEMLRQTLAPFAPGFALGSAVWVVTARA